MKKPPGIMLYKNDWDLLSELEIEERGLLLTAAFEYLINGTLPNFTGSLSIVFKVIRNSIDTNLEKYNAKCEQNRQNALSGWEKQKKEANASERMQPHQVAAKINNNPNSRTSLNPKSNYNNNMGSSSSCGQLLEQHGFGTSENSIFAISKLIAKYSVGWVEKALQIADENDNHKLSYVKGILKHWAVDGEISETMQEKDKTKQQELWDDFLKEGDEVGKSDEI